MNLLTPVSWQFLLVDLSESLCLRDW